MKRWIVLLAILAAASVVGAQGKVSGNWDSSGNLVWKESVTGNGASVKFGVDDHGIDVYWYGETTGEYMWWDESANQLKFVGGAGFADACTAAWSGATSGSIVISPISVGTNATTIVNQGGGSAKTITLPSATSTLPGLSIAGNNTGYLELSGATSGGIKVAPIATGTAVTTIQNQNVAAATITLPSATTTLPGLGLTNTWSASQTWGAANYTTYGVGAKAGATVSVVEYGTGSILHQTVFTLTALPLTLRDTEQGQGVSIYTFPEGRILFMGATGSVAETTTSTLSSTLNQGVTYNWGVGSTTQANGTLATTEQNIIQTTNGTASATINVAGAASNGVGVLAPLDGTTTPIQAYFNVGVAGASDIDGNATTTYTGTLTITWVNLGDY